MTDHTTRRIAAFVADDAHRKVVGALIARVAADLGVAAAIDWRSARRGYGQVVKELKDFLRDLSLQGDLPDLVVVATDANCKGQGTRRRQLPVKDCPVPVVLAVPDPHIERWLLLDGAACKAVLGQGCHAPDQKCARDRYKELLIRTVLNAGIQPITGGTEFAVDIVRAMDLERAARADVSLKRFLDDLRTAFEGYRR
jgi:hypothetical protein